MERTHGYVTELTEKEMNTIQKGILTELQCQIDFTKLGFNVSQPILPCRYDFVIDLGNKFIKVQCKTSHPIDENITGIQFECRSTRNVKSGIYNDHRKYTEDEIDYFYTSYNNQGYLIPIQECSTNKILRFSSINQNKNINWAYNYEIDKILQEEVSK